MILDTILITLVIFELFVIIDLWTDLKKAKAQKKEIKVIVVERSDLEKQMDILENFKKSPAYKNMYAQYRKSMGYMPVEMTEVKVTK